MAACHTGGGGLPIQPPPLISWHDTSACYALVCCTHTQPDAALSRQFENVGRQQLCTMGRLHSLFWFVAIVLSTSWIHRWSRPTRLPGPHIQGLHDLRKINSPLFWPNQSTHKNSSIHPWDNANLHSDPGLTRPGETFSSIWSTPSTIFWRFSSKIITIITAIVTFRVTPLNDICYSTTQSAESTT